MNRIGAAIAALAAIAIWSAAAPAAVAQTAAKKSFVGAFGDWEVYAEGKGKKRRCYMTSLPKKSVGKYKTRGNIQAFVTHEPGYKVRDQVSFTAGYTHKKASEIEVRVGGRTYRLFTKGKYAWARNAKQDKAMIRAMQAGAKMVVRGASSRGTKTTDTYSLAGFTAAYGEINKACGFSKKKKLKK